MDPLATLPLGTLRGQDEVRQLSRLCRPESARSAEDSEAQLRRVAQKFDAIFVRQILREMRNSQLKSSLFGQGQAGEIYQDLFDDCLADAIAEAGGFGIGKAIVKEVSGSLERLSAKQAVQLYEAQRSKGEFKQVDAKPKPIALAAEPKTKAFELESVTRQPFFDLSRNSTFLDKYSY